MKTEKVFVVIIIIGLIFKFLLDWPIGNVILVLSLSALSIIYFPFSFYFFSYKGLRNQNYALSIIGGMFFSTAIIGILFKLMYWPGSNEMNVIGLTGCIPLVILSFVLDKNIRSETDNSTSDSFFTTNGNDILDMPEKESGDEQKRINLKHYFNNFKIRSVTITAITLFMLL